MKKIVIKGGIQLSGNVGISGSKNAALPIMAATLLCDEEIILHNVPSLRDTLTMSKLLQKLGKKVEFSRDDESLVDGLPLGSMRIIPDKKNLYKATYDIVKQMRASICVLGPLLAKYGVAHVSLPGGCVFGPRPVDLHLKAMVELGAEISLANGYIHAEMSAKTTKAAVGSHARLIGKKMDLIGEFGPSVLATDNALMAASLAKGVTTIENAAREPETVDLIGFLNSMGCKISGAGSTTIKLEGVEKLHGCQYKIIPDRIEAGTFLTFAAATGGRVKINNIKLEHLKNVLAVYSQLGVSFQEIEGKDGAFDCLQVFSTPRTALRPMEVHTMPYPYFPTDMQPLLVSLMSVVDGNSILKENIYPNRFGYVAELVRMRAKISIESASVLIHGIPSLDGATVESSDLRGGAALLAAALGASGESHVRRIYHIERGYENIVGKLASLGASLDYADDKVL